MLLPFSIVLVFLLLGSASRAAEVSARLEIPAATTHVIGDPIPLVWHFTNSTTKPLAFVWEACCRLNGRLDIRHDGVALPTIPPGPGTAHQFAKPAIIGPGGEQRFESMLADWAFLTNSGRYEISGRYVGVVEGQRPPVPPSIALWRGQAVTPEAGVDLLTVSDYMEERATRSERRGLEATVVGPDRLPPVGPASFEVRIRNTASAPLALRWPLDADLWLVDQGGMRVFRSPTKPDVASKSLTIEPGATVAESFPVSVDDLNGAPLGDYGVFVDFPERNGQPRVPSTLHAVAWNPDENAVKELLVSASEGRSVGARNAPLRRLRQYLSALSPALERIPEEGLSPKARRLKHDLLLANCLSDLPVRTGRASLRAVALPGGDWKFDEPALDRCTTGPASNRLAQVASIRRHLGLEIAVDLQPDPRAAVGDVFAAARAIAAANADMAAAPRYVAGAPSNSVPGTVNFFAEKPDTGRWFSVFPADPSAEHPLLRGFHFVTENSEPPHQERSPAELATMLDRQASSAPASVVCPPTVTWRELRPWLEPFFERGLSVDLIAQ